MPVMLPKSKRNLFTAQRSNPHAMKLLLEIRLWLCILLCIMLENIGFSSYLHTSVCFRTLKISDILISSNLGIVCSLPRLQSSRYDEGLIRKIGGDKPTSETYRHLVWHSKIHFILYSHITSSLPSFPKERCVGLTQRLGRWLLRLRTM